MKIAYDISQIIYGTGVSHYRKKLIKNLLEIDKENEYLLYGFSLRRKKELEEFVKSLPKKVETKIFPIPLRVLDIVWNKLHVIKLEKLIGKVDLIHTSDWLEPPSDAVKVTTVHDLIPLKFPKMTPKSIVSVHKKKLYWVKNESKKILTPSNCTRNDLLGIGVGKEKIHVIPEANNLEKKSKKEIEKTKKKYKIREKYILSIGTKPRKNTRRIIDAFHLARAGKDIKLIIIGEIKGVKVQQDRGVRYTGFVNDSDLAALLTGAEVLVFPSLYEGLGIPILDAFACETPVVTSNIPPMSDVSGDGAVLVDPEDVNSIANGIGKALSKPKTLIKNGKKQLAKFSWQKCAIETLEVYKGAVK